MFVLLSMYDQCDEFIDSPVRSCKMEEAQQFRNCLVCRRTSKTSFQREDKKRPPLDVLIYWSLSKYAPEESSTPLTKMSFTQIFRSFRPRGGLHTPFKAVE